MGTSHKQETDAPAKADPTSKRYIKRGSFLKPALRMGELYLSERDQWVRIREISLGDFDSIEAAVSAEKNGQPRTTDFRARVILHGVIGEDDKPVFREEDLPAINDLPSKLANKIVEAITGLSLMQAESLEDETKNSEAGP